MRDGVLGIVLVLHRMGRGRAGLGGARLGEERVGGGAQMRPAAPPFSARDQSEGLVNFSFFPLDPRGQLISVHRSHWFCFCGKSKKLMANYTYIIK